MENLEVLSPSAVCTAAKLRSYTEADPGPAIELSISVPGTKLVTLSSAGCAALLMILSVGTELANSYYGGDGGVLPKLVKAFSADIELNVPNFFSMLLLILASVLLGVTAIVIRRLRAKYFFRWVVLSAGFMFMAFDEIASLHERTIEPLRPLLGGGELGIFYFAWVVPAALLIMVLAAYFLPFFASLPRRTALLFLLSGSLYLAGALGMEMIGGNHYEAYGKDVTYILLTTVEETLEFAGVVLFIYAIMDHLSRSVRSFHIDLAARPASTQQTKF